MLNSYQTSKRLFLPLSNAGLVKRVEQRLNLGLSASESMVLPSSLSVCSAPWHCAAMYEEVTLLKSLLGVLMCLSVQDGGLKRAKVKDAFTRAAEELQQNDCGQRISQVELD